MMARAMDSVLVTAGVLTWATAGVADLAGVVVHAGTMALNGAIAVLAGAKAQTGVAASLLGEAAQNGETIHRGIQAR